MIDPNYTFTHQKILNDLEKRSDILGLFTQEHAFIARYHAYTWQRFYERWLPKSLEIKEFSEKSNEVR